MICPTTPPGRFDPPPRGVGEDGVPPAVGVGGVEAVDALGLRGDTENGYNNEGEYGA